MDFLKKMNFLKRAPGVDGFSKDELKELIDSTCRVRDFIRNETACQMLEKLACPDQLDTHGSQTQQPPVGVSSNSTHAIKYLAIVKECERLRQATSVDEQDFKKVADIIVNELRDEFSYSGTDRPQALKQICIEYSARLVEHELYKKLVSNLSDAYERKM